MGMNRREFIRGFFATLVAAQVVQLPGPAAKALDGLSDWQKGSIIAEALKTTKGRDALGHYMKQPLRRQLDYQSIGRQVFQVQRLPDGALPIYDMDIDVAAYVVGDEGESTGDEEAITFFYRARRAVSRLIG